MNWKIKALEEKIHDKTRHTYKKKLEIYRYSLESLWSSVCIEYSTNGYTVEYLVCIGYWGGSFEIYIEHSNSDIYCTEEFKSLFAEYHDENGKNILCGKINDNDTNSFCFEKSYPIKKIMNGDDSILDEIADTTCQILKAVVNILRTKN